MRVRRQLTLFIVDRRAVTALEYGLIGALIFVVIIGSVSVVGVNVKQMFNSVASAL